MPAVLRKPDPQVRKTVSDEKVSVVINPGTPLSRLQVVHEDPEALLLVGDIRDVCNACDQSDAVVSKLQKMAGEKLLKGERIIVKPEDIEHVTALLTQV